MDSGLLQGKLLALSSDFNTCALGNPLISRAGFWAEWYDVGTVLSTLNY